MHKPAAELLVWAQSKDGSAVSAIVGAARSAVAGAAAAVTGGSTGAQQNGAFTEKQHIQVGTGAQLVQAYTLLHRSNR